jgi:hypothetical protein
LPALSGTLKLTMMPPKFVICTLAPCLFSKVIRLASRPSLSLPKGLMSGALLMAEGAESASAALPTMAVRMVFIG